MIANGLNKPTEKSNAIRTFRFDRPARRGDSSVWDFDIRGLGPGAARGADPAKHAGSSAGPDPKLFQAGVAFSQSNRPLRAAASGGTKPGKHGAHRFPDARWQVVSLAE